MNAGVVIKMRLVVQSRVPIVTKLQIVNVIPRKNEAFHLTLLKIFLNQEMWKANQVVQNISEPGF